MAAKKKLSDSNQISARSRTASRSRSKSENRITRSTSKPVVIEDNRDLTFKILRLLGVTPRSANDIIKGRKKDAIDKSQKILEDNGHPFSVSLFDSIMKLDPEPSATKWVYIILTAVFMILTLFVTEFLMYLTNTKGGIQEGMTPKELLFTCTKALKLTSDQILYHLNTSIVVFSLLVLVHYLGFNWPQHWYDATINKYSTSCYDEMFVEPLSSSDLFYRGRGTRIIARMGNTLSNISYLFAALCVTHTAMATWSNNLYCYADTLFGINLLLLSLFSTLWHAANYNKQHYLDLWVMDHAILYLIMRYMAMGLALWVPLIESYVPSSLFLFYLITFMVAFKTYICECWCEYGAGMFDKCFTPSGRRRLTQIDKHGQTDMTVAGMCLFTGLPIFYMALPSWVMWSMRRIGDPLALKTLTMFLTVAWTYRMLERFCVDGLPFMESINQQLAMGVKDKYKAGKGHALNWAAAHRGLLRLLAAIISPTAVLHWLTGLCLLAGYVHVRSLDEEIALL